MSAGTIYMYFARGGDSLNVSCAGEGNAVLIKSATPYQDAKYPPNMIDIMQQPNPVKNSGRIRSAERLCSGQILVCKSLGIKVHEWDQQQFNKNKFYIDDIKYSPEKIIQTTRLGIPDGRDGELPYRFIDPQYAKFCRKNPLTTKQSKYCCL